MLQEPPRTGLGGQTLIRWLAHLNDVDAPPSSPSLSGQLSQWLGWTEAIALSSALNGNPPALPGGPAGGAPAAADSAEARECARVRAMLTQAITADTPARGRRVPGRPLAPAEPFDPSADFAACRQRYLTLQQSMDSAIGKLRGRLRTALGGTPGMGRLAMVDAVMERVLGAREQSLLAGVPGLLEAHYEGLRRAEERALAEAEAGGAMTNTATTPAATVTAITPGTWRRVFRRDMQNVLLAELDLRFQPVEGLLAALRAS